MAFLLILMQFNSTMEIWSTLSSLRKKYGLAVRENAILTALDSGTLKPGQQRMLMCLIMLITMERKRIGLWKSCRN